MADPATAEPARPANLLHAVFEAAVAAVALIVADVLVRVVPFNVIARRIERTLRSTSQPAAPDLAVSRVTWAVNAAQRRLPWIPCLATAIAANRLLARKGIPSELWLGVQPNEPTTIAAHAWLIAQGRVVTGGAERQGYQPLHALVTSPSETPHPGTSPTLRFPPRS